MWHKAGFTLMSMLVLPYLVNAQEQTSVAEQLARLQEGQKGIQQRIDDVHRRIDDVNQRIDGLRLDVNNRLEDMNRKFNWVFVLLAAIIALNGAMVGSVVWMARQERPIGQKQYDEILSREAKLERDVADLKSRLERLEKA